MTIDQAVAFGLAETIDQSPAPSSTTTTVLTAREREVAALIARGLSNKDIAATLVISTRTAETHVQNILVKLGLTSRTQVSAWVADESSRP